MTLFKTQPGFLTLWQICFKMLNSIYSPCGPGWEDCLIYLPDHMVWGVPNPERLFVCVSVLTKQKRKKKRKKEGDSKYPI